MHFPNNCATIYICDYNWILLLNNNKNTFNNLFIFGGFYFWGNEFIFEIKLEFLVIIEMGVFKALLFHL